VSAAPRHSVFQLFDLVECKMFGSVTSYRLANEASLMARRMTKAELVRHLAEKAGTNRKTAAAFLDSLHETAVSEVKERGTFAVPGLGRLVRSTRKARIGRNPQTGPPIKVRASTVLKFRVEKTTQARISHKLLRLVLASPADVKPERNIVPEVVEELNRGVAELVGLRLEVARWEIDTYPGFHADGPQGLIDSILKITDADVLIGIFWKRFGTAVSDAGSGTEHEFRTAYRAWKRKRRPQIMMYFSQKSYSPKAKTETDQWGKVLDFQSNFPKEGLWWPYKNRREFEKLLREHLTNYLKGRKRRA